jgi:hypothetical protein
MQISIPKVHSCRNACVRHTAREELEQIVHKVAFPVMKLAVTSYVNREPAIELVGDFFNSGL